MQSLALVSKSGCCCTPDIMTPAASSYPTPAWRSIPSSTCPNPVPSSFMGTDPLALLLCGCTSPRCCWTGKTWMFYWWTGTVELLLWIISRLWRTPAKYRTTSQLSLKWCRYLSHLMLRHKGTPWTVLHVLPLIFHLLRTMVLLWAQSTWLESALELTYQDLLELALMDQ